MEIYKKTFYIEYNYSYFDGSPSSAVAIKDYLSNYCGHITMLYCYDNYTGEIFDTISHIDINNSGPLLSNYVDVKEGDYVLYSNDSNMFSLEKSLDEYIIDDAHHCRKPIEAILEYDQFRGTSDSVEQLIKEYKNEINSLVCSPDYNQVIISPMYGRDIIYLSRGDFLVRLENKRLLSIHFLDELDDCFKGCIPKDISMDDY